MPYTLIDSVTSTERTDRGAVFECTLQRRFTAETRLRDEHTQQVSRTIPIEITFFRPDVFRFNLEANPETAGGTGIGIKSDQVEAPVDIDYTEDQQQVILETDALSIHVGLDPWTFSVIDKSGQVLFKHRREERVGKNNRTVQPLGFSESEKSEWIYDIETTGLGFNIQPNEHYYGLGERFTAFDKRGHSATVKVTQPHSTDNTRAYKNVPFYLSTNGYGMFVDTTQQTEFSFGSGGGSAVGGEIRVHDDSLSFVFFSGPDLDDIVSTYTAIAGKSPLPPKWSFGLWTSRYSYETRDEIESITRRFREEDVPCDGVHLDISWMRDEMVSDLVWDESSFPDPESMIDELHQYGFRLMLIEEPYLSANTPAFKTAREQGFLVNNESGEPYLLDRLVVSQYRGGIIDFTNTSAVNWWQSKHDTLLEMGVDGFWTDFGEYLPEDAILSNGKSGKHMRNRFPHLYQKAVFESMSNANVDPLLWSRSGWAGTQRFPIHWSGDSNASFESLRSTLRGGLSLAASGYGFWSHDIGGFNGTPSSKLYIRWAQFGLLSSHARLHGKTPREPWKFGEQALSIFRKFATLRYRLLPYIYTVAANTCRSGIPVLRPLVLHHQDDPATHTNETEYYLGRDLLVAPVLSPDNHVEIYLPEGEWIDYWSGDRYKGRQTLHRTVPLNTIPLFVRAGSIIPQQNPNQHVTGGKPEQLTLTGRPMDNYAHGELFSEDISEMVSISVQIDHRVQILADHALSEVRIEITDINSEPDQVVVGRIDSNQSKTLASERWSYDGQRLYTNRVDFPQSD